MNTKDPSTLKQIVKQKYGEIAGQLERQGASTCCGSGCGCSSESDVMAEKYTNVIGYVKEADLGLGCGIPTEFAKINSGDTVVDLGSGAGNDCFVACSIVGEEGRVIGVDMTERMVARANENKGKLGFGNVEFRLGDIEEIPVESNTADVVVSNCVLNLVPDKRKAFGEMFRIIKPGGHFTISDVVLEGNLPDHLRDVAAMYAGCVSGAIQQADYLALLGKTGFRNIAVVKTREIRLPDELLLQYVSQDELQQYRNSGAGIFSITVYGEKP